MELNIVDVNPGNISEYPATCFLNPQNEGYKTKLRWLEKRFAEGMKVKLLYFKNDKKCRGYIEYVPGEFAWRAVNAKNYLFIHCLWITPNNFKNKGYGSLLLNECIKDAEAQNKNGAAVIVSDDSFMAKKDLFLKNGFSIVEESHPHLLLVKQLKKSVLPKLKDWQKQLKKYNGLNIVYSNQCPWVARFINEVDIILRKKKLKANIKELKTAREAQNAPSIYSVFNLINNGNLLANHYISNTRFLNILKKEKYE
jgi:ribosomal protein S18 acetylase RimI-like enzyme